MKKFLVVMMASMFLIVGGMTDVMASGEIGIGKVIDDTDIFNVAAKYNLNDNFYVSGNVDFNSSLDEISNEEYKIGGKVEITSMATIMGSFEDNASNQEIKTIALDTKITDSITTRTQYKQVDSEGKTMLHLFYNF